MSGGAANYVSIGVDPQLILPPFEWNGSALITLIVDIEAQISKAEAFGALEAELNLKADKLARMQNSMSWKITAPIRAMRRFISK